MKVKISFTIDIDPDYWETSYGITGAQAIREDVKTYAENTVRDHFDSVGALA